MATANDTPPSAPISESTGVSSLAGDDLGLDDSGQVPIAVRAELWKQDHRAVHVWRRFIAAVMGQEENPVLRRAAIAGVVSWFFVGLTPVVAIGGLLGWLNYAEMRRQTDAVAEQNRLIAESVGRSTAVKRFQVLQAIEAALPMLSIRELAAKGLGDWSPHGQQYNDFAVNCWLLVEVFNSVRSSGDYDLLRPESRQTIDVSVADIASTLDRAEGEKIMPGALGAYRGGLTPKGREAAARIGRYRVVVESLKGRLTVLVQVLRDERLHWSFQ